MKKYFWKIFLFFFLVSLGLFWRGKTQAASLTSFSDLKTVFIIVMENKSWSQVKDPAVAPYLNNTLLPQSSYANQYFTPAGLTASLPNYLWLEAGDHLGILENTSPRLGHQATTDHLVTYLNNKGLSWKSYQEDISGTVCPLIREGNYVPRHNAMVYFDDVTGDTNYCLAHIRPFTELAGDLNNNTVGRYNFITPNLCNDSHDCPISTGDAWLSNVIPMIMNSQAYKDNGVIFLTWDEGSGASLEGPIGMVVTSPVGKGGGYNNNIRYTHSSTLRTLQEIFGVTPFLRDAGNSNDLSDLFNFSSSGPTPTPTPTPTPIPSPTPTLTPTPTATPTPSPSGKTTVFLEPAADAYVRKDKAGQNFGREKILDADGDPVTVSYLKFKLDSLAGKTINHAKLRLKVSNPSKAVQTLRIVPDNSWGESLLNFNNRPAPGEKLANLTGTVLNEVIEIDLTDFISTKLGKTVSLAITSSESNGISFFSKEALSGAPNLKIQY